VSDFNYSPSFPPKVSYQPRVTEATFGDGYSQRVGDGINTNPQSWSLTFAGIDNATADAIVSFLSGKAAVTSFTWTPPGGTEIRVICKTWQRIRPTSTHSTVTATFDQVFEP